MHLTGFSKYIQGVNLKKKKKRETLLKLRIYMPKS
jgi:hypothetical protein